MFVTIKEHLHKLVDELSEADADATLEFVASRGGHGESEPRRRDSPSLATRRG
jgi:hypothetical protein